MRYGRIWGVALGAAAAVALAGCGDDEQAVVQNDLSMVDDLSVTPDMGPDQSAAAPATAQITVADVTGIVYLPAGGGDGGTPLPQTHSLAVVVDLPLDSGTDQHVSGTSALHGCTWNRYNNLPPSAGGMGPFPASNENAGSVAITGYDTTFTLGVDITAPALPAPLPASSINCTYNAMSHHFDCYFGSDTTKLVGNYIFPAGIPTGLPSPSPQAFNTDLYKSGTGDNMIDNAVKEAFTPSPAPSTYTDARSTNLTGLPKNPHVFTVNGNASTMELEDLIGKLDGSADLTIEFSCDASISPQTKGAGCSLGGITGLLIQTSLGKKWEPASGANLLRFGTAQCVEADDGSSPHSFTLPKAMIQEILGSDMNQSIRVVLVRLKANSVFSGMHPFYETAGRGIFSFIDQ